MIQIVTNLELLLRDFYELYKLVPAEGRSITGQPAKNYPTFSNFLSFLDDQIEVEKTRKYTSSVDAGLAQNKALIVNQIRDAVSTIVGNYGAMFDGHTSVDNLVDEKIVTFDISDIKDLGNVFCCSDV